MPAYLFECRQIFLGQQLAAGGDGVCAAQGDRVEVVNDGAVGIVKNGAGIVKGGAGVVKGGIGNVEGELANSSSDCFYL